MNENATAATDNTLASGALESFGFVDIGKFLLGSRHAIEKLARSKRAWLLGALLVATAAFCREYDAVSLLHHPVDLLAPFGASLVLSVVLFSWLHAMPSGNRDKSRDNLDETDFAKQYVVFLTAYWLTAPLAWLYAIPVEILLSEYGAAYANLVFLSVVSLWRILLFARFVSVWKTTGYWTALNWILVPCCAIAFVALVQRNINIVGLMGGIRLTQTEQLVVDYQGTVMGTIGYVLPIAVVGCILSYFFRRKSRNNVSAAACSVARSAWLTPCVVCVPLVIGVFVFQPLLYRATVVDRKLRGGEIQTAIDIVSQAGSLTKFPANWDPLPTKRDSRVKVMALVEAFETQPAPAWVMDLLLLDAAQLLIDEYFPPFMYGAQLQAKNVSKLDPSDQREILDSARRLAALSTDDPLTEKSRAELVEVIEAAVKASSDDAEQ